MKFEDLKPRDKEIFSRRVQLMEFCQTEQSISNCQALYRKSLSASINFIMNKLCDTGYMKRIRYGALSPIGRPVHSYIALQETYPIADYVSVSTKSAQTLREKHGYTPTRKRASENKQSIKIIEGATYVPERMVMSQRPKTGKTYVGCSFNQAGW